MLVEVGVDDYSGPAAVGFAAVPDITEQRKRKV